MQTLFQKMRSHRSRWVDQPIKATDDAWRLKAMVIDGVAYVEKPGPTCNGCEFKYVGSCDKAGDAATAAFGGRCGLRGVIYIKAE